MTQVAYDSRQDTMDHIGKVREFLAYFRGCLEARANVHDRSKLADPEKAIFDEYTPKLKGVTYGSEKYQEFLGGMNVALQHHYAKNSHHPEHCKEGINGMDLLDLIEMFCDWSAATTRHADGDLAKSIRHNTDRFSISDQLVDIFRNTAKLPFFRSLSK